MGGAILVFVRLGKPVSFGKVHWIIWGPTAIAAFASALLAGIMAGIGVNSLFIGTVSLTTALAVFSTAVFSCLIGTLVVIRRNLAAAAEPKEPWPPLQEKQPRPSFATEDIDALKDGSSWITSTAGKSGSMSAMRRPNLFHAAAEGNGSLSDIARTILQGFRR